MAGSSYIPSREAELVTFALNFDALVTAAPAAYGLAGPDAASIHFYVAAFAAAHTLASDPSASTLGTVADKDAKKAALIDVLRGYAQRIKHNAGVADVDKVNLGLNLNDDRTTPVPPPATYPLFAVSIPAALRVECRISDSGTPDSAARPRGAVGAQVFVSTLPEPPADPSTWRFAGLATRRSFLIDFDGTDAGKTARLAMRWQNRRGQVGPWSASRAMAVIGT